MNNKEVFKQILIKAIERGYRRYNLGYVDALVEDCLDPEKYDRYTTLETVIFSHDFARAFWGEEIIKIRICPDGKEIDERVFIYKPRWLVELEQMVGKENRIKYLERFL